MRTLISRSTSPRLQVWIAGLSLFAWIALSPVTMLSGLRSSLPWLTFASLFANVATCFGWWVSSLVNVKAERIDDRSDEVATVAHIDGLATQMAEAVDRIDRMEAAHGDQLAKLLDAIHFPSGGQVAQQPVVPVAPVQSPPAGVSGSGDGPAEG